jgi:hypothetical protein
MQKLEIDYPFKPFIITQRWGVPNPAYALHFEDPDFGEHNGTDATAHFNTYDGKRMTEWPVYCPVEGFYVERVQYVPNGGGHEIWLRSSTLLQIGDRQCYARLILCHAKKVLVKAGYEPARGELIMIADNTGFSTGPHTHIGLYRIDRQGRKLDTNKATGSYDPARCFTNDHAIDNASGKTLLKSNLRYAAYFLGAI